MNYYRAQEKKAEHGGGWVVMQLNRREGAAVACGCREGPDNGWSEPGHGSKGAAELCFYQFELNRPIRRSTSPNQLVKCARCGKWTQQHVSAGNLIFGPTALCTVCAPTDSTDEVNDAAARLSLERVHPYRQGIEIAASW